MTPCDFAAGIAIFGEMFGAGFAGILLLWAAAAGVQAILHVIRGR